MDNSTRSHLNRTNNAYVRMYTSHRPVLVLLVSQLQPNSGKAAPFAACALRVT
jgi:hypothetical protein